MASVLVPLLSQQSIKSIQPVDVFTGDSIEITNAWQDISNVINVKGAESIILWLTYDVNSSVDTQIRALVGDVEGNCVYSFAIETFSASKIDVQGEVVELLDADLNIVKQFVLDSAINFIKFQIKDSADGSGQIDKAMVSIQLR